MIPRTRSSTAASVRAYDRSWTQALNSERWVRSPGVGKSPTGPRSAAWSEVASASHLPTTVAHTPKTSLLDA